MGLRIAAIVAFVTLAGCKDERPLRPDSAPADAALDDAQAGACSGGSVGYLADCTDMAQCGGGCECHDFGHSQVCTPTCTTNDDCPAPSPGCSSTGYCRK